MRVDWAILCRYAEVTNDLVTIIGGGVDAFPVEAVPADMSVWAALRLLGLPDDQPHMLRVEIIDPLMQPVGEAIEGELRMAPPGPTFPAGWEMNVMIPILLRFSAPSEGAYTLVITVDGSAHTMAFRVITPEV